MNSKVWEFLRPYFPADIAGELALTGIIFLPMYVIPAPAVAPATSEWVLTFNDEFSEPYLDRIKWSTLYGNGGGGEEQQYVGNAFSQAASVLTITAKKEEYAGRHYTSGIIHTQNRWEQLYGRFEIKAKVPAGQGYWPAFWMLTTDAAFRPLEIDVFEILGDDARVGIANLVNHWEGGGKSSYKYNIAPATFADDFHTYMVEWEPELITWYVDGEVRHRSTEGIPQVPMFPLINLAVGGNWPGSPDDTTVFPGKLEVDYIRVWQHVDRMP